MNKKRFERFEKSEITLSRVVNALKLRIGEIPHSLAWNFSVSGQKNRESLLQYKNIHFGKRCFIIANGPSLQRTNLELLAQEYTFGLNRIYLHFNKSSFRPTYQVIVNELILEQWAKEISQLEMPKFLNWNRRVHFGDPDSKTTYVKSKLVLKDSFQYDVTRPLVVGATVTFVALQLAYYMGFAKVILIGLDHKYQEKGIPSKTEIRQPEQDKDHFVTNYFPKGARWQLPDLRRSEIDFSIARKAFEADGREILDATVDGNCQIFKKTNYMSLFT